MQGALETDTGVLFKPMGSLRCHSHNSLEPIDEETKKGIDNKGAASRPRVRRRRKTSDIVKVSSKEGTQSASRSEAPDATSEAEEGSGSSNASFSLKGSLELLKDSMVTEPWSNSLKALTTLARVLSSPVIDMATHYSYVEGALLLSI